jgi:hypothetical protein
MPKPSKELVAAIRAAFASERGLEKLAATVHTKGKSMRMIFQGCVRPDRNSKPSDRYELAMHEAAHAVAAVRLGGIVRSVEIAPDSRSGFAVVKDPDDPFAGGVIAFAGMAADECTSGDPLEFGFNSPPDNPWCDGACVASYAKQANPEEPLTAVRDMFRAARKLVREEWATITELAAEVMRSGTVSGDEVRRIVNGAAMQ